MADIDACHTRDLIVPLFFIDNTESEKKVLFLKLETEHFTSTRARRAWIATVLKQRVCVRWAGDTGILADVGI